jgi:calcineurin-like phosphoesterase family protein
MTVVWFSADQHFGHANIIRHCDRPFSDVATMDAVLIERWNAVVGEQDEVWCLGDFAMKIDQAVAITPLLKGRKRLIAGNHDNCLGDSESKQLRRDALMNAGWETIDEFGMIKLDGYSVLLAHLPYAGEEDIYPCRNLKRPVDNGSWLLHGHIHNHWIQKQRMINVGVDVWDFAPISAAKILEIIVPYERIFEPIF